MLPHGIDFGKIQNDLLIAIGWPGLSTLGKYSMVLCLIAILITLLGAITGIVLSGLDDVKRKVSKHGNLE